MPKQTRPSHRQARLRQKRFRKAAFMVIVVAVLGLSGYLLINAFFRPGPPPMAGNVIDIAADMAGFDQDEIRIKVGEPVTIRLTSLDNSHHTDGGGQHQWAVDEFGLDVVAQPLNSNYVTFMPEKPGKYTFYCDICCGGRANPTMNGTLIVEA
jgi:cytochrome c oxidase subunit II